MPSRYRRYLLPRAPWLLSEKSVLAKPIRPVIMMELAPIGLPNTRRKPSTSLHATANELSMHMLRDDVEGRGGYSPYRTRVPGPESHFCQSYPANHDMKSSTNARNASANACWEVCQLTFQERVLYLRRVFSTSCTSGIHLVKALRRLCVHTISFVRNVFFI